MRIRQSQVEALRANARARDVAVIESMVADLAAQEGLGSPTRGDLFLVYDEAVAEGLETLGQIAALAFVLLLSLPMLDESAREFLLNVWRGRRRPAPDRLNVMLAHLEAGFGQPIR